MLDVMEYDEPYTSSAIVSIAALALTSLAPLTQSFPSSFNNPSPSASIASLSTEIWLKSSATAIPVPLIGI